MKTVSLELARELKKAGYPQESTYAYYFDKYNTNLWEKKSYIEINGREVIDSPTADEILDLLPHFLKGEYIEIWKEKWGSKIVWLIGFEGLCSFDSDTLANAAAKMWLYLKENDLL